MTEPLFAHQQHSIKFQRTHDRVFDMSEPGTGKTRVVIEDFAHRRSKGAGPMLVFAPKSLLYSAWGKDIKTFAPHLSVSIAYAENRAKAFAVDADVYITNHDAVKWVIGHSSLLKRFANGLLVCDESTAFKHRTSQRSKAISHIAKYFTVRRMLSGSPTTNGICDIWHQMYLIDDGKRLGIDFFQFRSACCTPRQVGPNINMVEWTDRPDAEAAVAMLINDVVIRHKFEDCVDIPENYQYSVSYKLPPKLFKQYKQLERDSILKLSEMKHVSAINAAVLSGKLLQVCSGAIYGNDGNANVLDVGRYELTMDIAEERRHSIVFFYWRHQRDALIVEAKRRGLTYAVLDGTVTRKGEREEITRLYEAGFYRCLFAHPKSAAHGLTLIKGTATIWPDPTSNLEWYLQGLKRIHRIGQTEKTETIVVVSPDTIEESVFESLMAKDGKMSRLMSYLKPEKKRV